MLTLVMLLAFVLVAAVVPKGNAGHPAVATKKIVFLAADSASKTYATVLASVGGSFVAILFGALTTTVAFAFMKRKGGSND